MASEARGFRAGDTCDRCPLNIVSACLACGFGGCAVHMAEHMTACPDESVEVPLPLAQRILAALEREATFTGAKGAEWKDPELIALADELRGRIA